MKRWRAFHECCPGCLGHTVTYTEREPVKGDMAFCRSCQCQGVVDRDPWGLYIEWPEDLCAKCHRRIDAHTVGLVKRIKDVIRITRILTEIEESGHGR